VLLRIQIKYKRKKFEFLIHIFRIDKENVKTLGFIIFKRSINLS